MMMVNLGAGPRDRKKQDSFCGSALLFGRIRSRSRSKINFKFLLIPEAQKLLHEQKLLQEQKHI